MEDRSPQQIWQAALGELQIQVNRANYQTWLSKTQGLSYQDEQFVIGVPNTFIAEYLDTNQRSLIEKVLTGITRQEVEVQFRIHESQQTNILKHRNRGKSVTSAQPGLPLLNPKYTFDSFVVGTCNQLAYAAARGVSQNPGQVYNPLFVYGGAGVGKTHLLHAIGHAAISQNINTLYVSAEQYTNELMTALRENTTEEFRNKYRSVDMLLVDDIQFFSGKEQTRENFFYTFDDLHNTNRQIAVTSNCPPSSLPLLTDRLRSRFEGGLVTDIQAPDFDTRLAILKAKATQDGINASADVLEIIAMQIKQNIRALEGSLNRVVAYARLVRSMLTPELTARALKDIGGNDAKPDPVTPSQITESVVDTFQITPSDLKGRKRDEATALARQVAMYLIRQETDSSLSEIGRELGGRSAATVSHAYQKIADAINTSPPLRRRIVEIKQRIYARQKNGIY
ncbi:MAG: chromosomal replication initiator protein DnaA [Dehalococcoidales bacterium]|nr:MAG: chromosomal replication initiator protein DnaA [Dehalococcoidales bacterium]